MRRLALAAGVALLVAACGDAGDAPPPTAEQQATRAAAARQACAARSLEETAAENLATLEEARAAYNPNDPMAAINLAAMTAASDFARAFASHAELRTGAYAYLDSAVNRAASAADSARYLEQAGRYSITMPQPNTLEANVMEDYQRGLQEILLDADHRCNWDTLM